MTRFIPILICLLALTAGLTAAGLAPTSDYAAVEAIFTENCLDCHGSTEPEGKLIMESFDQLIQGGKSGPVIVAGKSEESLLVKMIEGRVEKDGKTLIMPPRKKREKLKPEQIELIKAWIDAGAKPPAEFKPKELVVPKIEPKHPPRRSVHSIAYSAAQKLIAAARCGEVELRSAETHAVVRALEGHRGNVNAVVFSPDGKFLFAAGGEPGGSGEVRQWNVADGGLVRVFEGHKDAIYSVALSPDGKTLATGSYDQKVKLWSVETGESINILSGHNGAVFGLAFRPDGKILASASADRTVKLWDVAAGERRDTLSQPLKDQYTIAFSPDGKKLVAGGVDNRIRVWQISETAAETTNPLLEARFAHEGAVLNVTFSSDGKSLVSSADDRTVKLWDTTGPELVEKLLLDKQPDWAPALAFALEDQAVVVGRLDGSIEFYDAASGKIRSPPKPEVLRAEPRGIQRGRQVKVKLIGSHLEGATAVKCLRPELSVELDTTAERAPGEVWVTVTTPDNLPRGAYELTLTGLGGESGKIKLHVDDLPQVLLPHTNGIFVLESLPADVWATHEKTGDAEQIEFAAKAGQTIVFDAAARRLDSKSDLVLTLSDSTGRVLASNNGFDASADPFLAYTFSTDGRYRVLVNELVLGASPDHFYRLSVGGLPYVTGCYPLSAPVNAAAEIELIGPNLPAEHAVKVKAEKPGEMELPIDTEKFRSRRAFKLIIGEGAELVEIEPNDAPEQATRLTPPCAVNGRIFGAERETGLSGQPGRITAPGSAAQRHANEADVDLFRFEAKAGQTWIIETAAAQLGSPVDTRIEVLDAAGKLVERLVLQAVRNTAINFRSIDSNGNGARLDNYEEMELNEYVYFNGEVVKLFRMPQGPDSDMLFYSSDGKRRAYFDTSAMAHALDEPAYVVVPHPPGIMPGATGLPVFHLDYANDDDGERKLGSDSKLRFTAPADGIYLIRVTDTRNYSGDRFAYRLIIREPKPDFKVTLNGADPTVNAGSGREFSISAERFDGFDGDIEVTVTNLPPGFSVSSPLIIQSGHSEAKGTLCAALNAAKPDETNAALSRVTATALIGGKATMRDVKNFGRVTLGEKPKLFVLFEPDPPARPVPQVSNDAHKPYEITIAPGQTIPAWLKIRRNGHDDLVTFTVENLPHGVIVDNIGLNGVLIPKGENERQISLTAAKWVPETDRFCYAVENQAGRQTSVPLLLHVRRAASPVAAAQ
jgi:mono/diheme cytochrome c family protein